MHALWWSAFQEWATCASLSSLSCSRCSRLSCTMLLNSSTLFEIRSVLLRPMKSPSTLVPSCMHIIHIVIRPLRATNPAVQLDIRPRSGSGAQSPGDRCQADLVQVCFEFQILQTLLQKGDERSRRNILVRHPVSVHHGLIAEGKRRMIEPCGKAGPFIQNVRSGSAHASPNITSLCFTVENRLRRSASGSPQFRRVFT